MKRGLILDQKRSDKLVAVFRDEQGRMYRQGKRVSAACPMTQEERRVYVKEGALRAVGLIMKRQNVGLAVAKQFLDFCRY